MLEFNNGLAVIQWVIDYFDKLILQNFMVLPFFVFSDFMMYKINMNVVLIFMPPQ